LKSIDLHYGDSHFFQNEKYPPHTTFEWNRPKYNLTLNCSDGSVFFYVLAKIDPNVSITFNNTGISFRKNALSVPYIILIDTRWLIISIIVK